MCVYCILIRLCILSMHLLRPVFVAVVLLCAAACASGEPAARQQRVGSGRPAVSEGSPADAEALDDGAGAGEGRAEPVAGAGVSDAVGVEPNAVVERVVDGDTVVVRVGDRSETVRLIGIDTPESVDRARPVQCYGAEASRRLAETLPVGTAVTLVRDIEPRDAYDRLLAYVVRSSDELFVNLDLVIAGYAAVLEYPPNVYYSDLLARAESAAIAAGRGLWGVCGGADVPLH